MVHYPPPPPQERNPDGTLKKYRLHQWTYKHGYTWERWRLMPVGVFHTVYKGDFACDQRWFWAWLGQYPVVVGFPPFFAMLVFINFLFMYGFQFGVKPKRYTVEWIEAEKERDRCENTNPVGHYLDRRRRERGPHWIMQDYLIEHPFRIWMGPEPHDYELLRKREAAKAGGGDDDDEDDE
uniref:Cg8 protein n=1 Tax=Chromera velia CCMP2878 TaxID=1169474 RepID=A0A0G4HC95_9ALVE|eukprot:Cvel_26023.t1-p1 / transcript=Cvel_26023.t1 / gene=Cvel_26023 / organism=Chromera_velia_CCMP2878 / gene_product=hypothetical protein / transcript_product=hypothetical protein / location=Cvel_scaffold3030:17587-18949(+) / protein_length=179 / sequence_SO=supercontig / SO=protein_coding / is_pseudo=false